MKKYRGKSRKLFLRRKRTTKKGGVLRGKGLVRLIKNVSLRQSETKFQTLSGENLQLQHNGGTGPTYVRIFNLLATNQGQTQETRLGDKVIAKGLSIRLWLSNKLDRPNVMYRIIVFSGPRDQISIASPNNFFEAHIGNKMIDMVNTDKYKIIKQRIIRPFAGDYSLESSATNKEHSTYLAMYIPLKNRQVSYGNDNEDLPTFTRDCISVAILAYDAYGTLTTDTIASFSYLTKFYFKDP